MPEEFTPPRATPADTVTVLAPTVEALRAAGFEVDPQLWVTSSGKCSQCHAGCTNCGQGGGDGLAAARQLVTTGQ